MSAQRILVVEDEKDMSLGLRDILESEGYEVVTAGTGREGLHLAGKKTPDCIILDLMLPDVSGYEVCEQIRQKKLTTPILMLTARAQEYDKIRGFKVGADDYLTKPFGIGELLARVMALLRRHGGYGVADLDEVRVGSSVVDARHFIVRRDGVDHSMSHYEVELFKLLYSRVNQPVGRDEILLKIWGATESFPTNRTVDNFIVKLRKKIEEDYRNPRHILTVYGVGYKLSP
ncbi:MAG: response regulator transcription factor [Acidobacteriota bacterium]|jgi:DNA-binding response OmpR family regulator|nr:response regulator transcription factor [Acidobacteriota bacterium]